MDKHDEVIAAWLGGHITRDQMERDLIELFRAGTARRAPVGEAQVSSREKIEGRFLRRGIVFAAAWEKTEGHCWYCGAAESDALEHQIPKTRGGGYTRENCVIACRTCNSRKARRTVEEFRTYMMAVHGRPPTSFFGEPAASRERDWLIVCNTPLAYAPGERVSDRIAAYLR